MWPVGLRQGVARASVARLTSRRGAAEASCTPVRRQLRTESAEARRLGPQRHAWPGDQRGGPGLGGLRFRLRGDSRSFTWPPLSLGARTWKRGTHSEAQACPPPPVRVALRGGRSQLPWRAALLVAVCFAVFGAGSLFLILIASIGGTLANKIVGLGCTVL